MLWAGAPRPPRDSMAANKPSPPRPASISLDSDPAAPKPAASPESRPLHGRQSYDISVDSLLAPVPRSAQPRHQPLLQSSQAVPDEAMDLDSPPQASSYSACRPLPGPAHGSDSRHHPVSNGRDAAAKPHARSLTNSRGSSDTALNDRVPMTPASDSSNSHIYRGSTPLQAKAKPRLDFNANPNHSLDPASHQAATNDALNTSPNSRKRLADGKFKARSRSHSPHKGHLRTASGTSLASTSTSSISELSAELKTRLSYAMFKVAHGWESKTIDEVEVLASEIMSPVSTSSTAHRRHASSTSPRLAPTMPQVRFAPDPAANRRPLASPPLKTTSGALAPPASIQPLATKQPPGNSNPRRNSNPRYTPTMLSQSHSASPQTPAQVSRPDSRHSISRGEQDAAESLLFMSSPGNSANLKHTFSPVPSPAIQALLNPAPSRNTGTRHALPDGPRKALPSHRPPMAAKRAETTKPGAMPLHLNPVDEDPARHFQRSSDRGGPKRPVNDTVYRPRTLLPLPTGLPLGNGPRRKLQTADIELMLDHAMAREHESSDDEPIQMPKR
ncbi:hypothetical protein CDD82_6059 [Ophiocordyceps australis]|uniref:Uncharacterized protein n=1 Tax=Ophiocordyceps australis TaxID=1399860 RepID=A0A2C5YZA6_9HYPO|nr:hypothetical protein CDD82_6059 [Ophiocordyceps australis]